MCRWLAYAGAPVFLDSLVSAPEHSLIAQSLRARQSVATTNGDGFGIGWYGDRPEPGLFRDTLPAWNDGNLLSLCEQIRSRLFFCACPRIHRHRDLACQLPPISLRQLAVHAQRHDRRF